MLAGLGQAAYLAQELALGKQLGHFRGKDNVPVHKPDGSACESCVPVEADPADWGKRRTCTHTHRRSISQSTECGQASWSSSDTLFGGRNGARFLPGAQTNCRADPARPRPLVRPRLRAAAAPPPKTGPGRAPADGDAGRHACERR
eukprot:scaffold4124_cov378-Prasinococcus_capsulatus_cf.AAC.3